MKELIIFIVKNYYTELVTHGLVFLMGMGVGLAIPEIGRLYEKTIYQGSDGDETGEENNG